GVELFSLQVGAATAELLHLPSSTGVMDLGKSVKDFADTAALAQAMDLVVTIDTSMAHLAGALGKPVWVLLPRVADWRWLIGREDSPWYPTARLFRQEKAGEWATVLERVRAELIKMAPAPVEVVPGAADPSTAGTSQTSLFRRSRGPANEFFNLGLSKHQRGDLPGAICHYQEALGLNPQLAPALLNLGVAWKDSRRFELAKECFGKLLELHPGHPEASNNLGVVLQAEGDLESALPLFRHATGARPGYTDAELNLGVVLRELGNVVEAIQWHRRTIARQPDCAEAHWNLGFALLLDGQLAEGWLENEWRWRMGELRGKRRDFACPEWRGEPLAGRSILLHAEQGFGDTLQFVRYLPLVIQRGGRVVLECQPELVSLLQGLPGLAGVVARGTAPPPCDFHLPLLSLPRVFRTSLHQIPATAPYVPAPSSPVLLDPADGVLRVGLVWGGNPSFRNDRSRSFTLAEYRPLLDEPRVQFYSLQVGARAGELKAPGETTAIVDLAPRLKDFAATAAAIKELDLVITSDTAVAHLAGALGKPVWVLLSFAPDWRWLLHRNDSPWYPSMRLFRQTTRGDWASVVVRVREALRERVSNARTAARI
ncbi:MAG TPA: tetratricopeptide repeat protein, partial [Verrucomicrobiae bacterium]|nr:tetratricopeptide repeat protein [Verrucomicrobiae bacterium]